MSKILIVTSVKAEADAIGDVANADVVISGIGRTNAAAATTEWLVRSGPYDVVVNAGVAGSLPESGLAIGDIVVASRCVYMEEGLLHPDGFSDMAEMGFALGDFAGNAVPVQAWLTERAADIGTVAPIATVATCSGTNAQALLTRNRTGAVAEAMEGAAVVHAALRLNVPAIEIRAISNTTGNRPEQRWDLKTALESLRNAVHRANDLLDDN